jgi:hypothetical protein
LDACFTDDKSKPKDKHLPPAMQACQRSCIQLCHILQISKLSKPKDKHLPTMKIQMLHFKKVAEVINALGIVIVDSNQEKKTV